MRRIALLSSAVALAAVARPADAQLAVGARIGTTGVAAEVSYAVAPRLALRGTGAIMPVKPTGEFSDVEYEVELPSPVFTAGVDLYLTRALRLMGGLLIGADELTLDGTYTGSTNFGGQTYTGSGTITGSVETSSTAPFVGIGFGRTIGSGVGFNLDIGAAILGESTVRIDATGPIRQAPDYEQRRQQEQENIQEDVDKYAKVYPLLSFGVRIGVGSR